MSDTFTDLTRDLTQVLSTGPGRRVVWALCGFAQPYRPPFTPDPLVTAFQAGEQNVGLKILDLVQRAAPAHYILMLQEYFNVPNLPDAITDPGSAEATRRVADPGRNTLDPRSADGPESLIGGGPSEWGERGPDSPDHDGAGLSRSFPLPGGPGNPADW